MRRLTVLVLAAATALASARLAGQSAFQFFVYLADTTGKPADSLTKEMVTVTEDGAEGAVARIEPVDWPVKVTLLVDNGTGSSERLVHMRNGLKGFLEAMPLGVEVSLLTTAPQPRFVVRQTNDRTALLAGVDRITPDSSAGRFVEGLQEAMARFDKERGNAFPVVVVLGSQVAEGSAIRERDIETMLRRVAERAATVHVVMVGSATQSLSGVGGANQTQIGLAVTKQSGGRYEAIAASTRLATLLPEIGAQIAASHAKQSHQYRVTFERPGKKSGPVGAIGLAVPAGLTPNLTIDGHMP
jgi:hypothetical protein